MTEKSTHDSQSPLQGVGGNMFHCHKAKLIIEIDGGYHQIPEQYLYDKNRDSELEEFGLKTIRFTNKQVLFETEQVLNMIKDVAKNRLGTYLK